METVRCMRRLGPDAHTRGPRVDAPPKPKLLSTKREAERLQSAYRLSYLTLKKLFPSQKREKIRRREMHCERRTKNGRKWEKTVEEKEENYCVVYEQRVSAGERGRGRGIGF